MICIFCRKEKPPSEEHVFPESIGGTLVIKNVCRGCNSDLSRLVDNPFAKSPIIQVARYAHSLGGKRDIVPFPFAGVGTFDDGRKVTVDRDFKPNVKRSLKVDKLADGSLGVEFGADLSDRENFEQMLGKPLRKELAAAYPEWSTEKLDAEVARIVEHARTVPPTEAKKPIKFQLRINRDDLLFEFLKIAYGLPRIIRTRAERVVVFVS